MTRGTVRGVCHAPAAPGSPTALQSHEEAAAWLLFLLWKQEEWPCQPEVATPVSR